MSLCTLLVHDYLSNVVDRVCWLCSNQVSGNGARYSEEYLMATNDGVVKVELNAIERAWIRQAIGTQRKVLIRARGNEMAGSEIAALRGREIEALVAIEQKLV